LPGNLMLKDLLNLCLCIILWALSLRWVLLKQDMVMYTYCTDFGLFICVEGAPEGQNVFRLISLHVVIQPISVILCCFQVLDEGQSL
jgi:hypothetical protein